MTRMRITAAALRRHRACPEQVKIFREAWPGGVEPSLRAAQRAAGLGLDADWFVKEFCPSLYAEYRRLRQPIDAEYLRQRQPLYAEYRRLRQPIDAEYLRQLQPIDAEYERQLQPIYAEYERQLQPIDAEYMRQRWELVWRLVRSAS